MRRFKANEMVVIALIVTSTFILGYVLLPLLMMVPLHAYKALVIAPLYGAGVALCLFKVPRFGVISFLGILLGMLLSMFAVWMLPISAGAGVATDIICGAIFRGYSSTKSRVIAAGLFPALQLPTALFVMLYAIGSIPLNTLRQPLFVVFLPTLVAFLLGGYTGKYTLGLLETRKIVATKVATKPLDEH